MPYKEMPMPQNKMSMVIEPDLAVRVFCSDVEMSAIGEYRISKHVTEENTLQILMENMKKNGHRRTGNENF